MRFYFISRSPTMKNSSTLVIVTHPDIAHSVVNKRWLEQLQQSPDRVTIHQLHAQYPDGKIDIAAEQQLLLDHDNIVLQFPLYWFSTPPLLKTWQDEVLAQGFAYGRNASERQLAGKRIGLAISAGIKAVDYHENGRYQFTVEELTRPLQLTISYIGAEWLPTFASYGAESGLSEEELAASANDYLDYIRQISTASADAVAG